MSVEAATSLSETSTSIADSSKSLHSSSSASSSSSSSASSSFRIDDILLGKSQKTVGQCDDTTAAAILTSQQQQQHQLMMRMMMMHTANAAKRRLVDANMGSELESWPSFKQQPPISNSSNMDDVTSSSSNTSPSMMFDLANYFPGGRAAAFPSPGGQLHLQQQRGMNPVSSSKQQPSQADILPFIFNNGKLINFLMNS
jgi:hypothetical protein